MTNENESNSDTLNEAIDDIDEGQSVFINAKRINDEFIRVLEMNADDEAERVLRNFGASLSNLNQYEIEELLLQNLLKLYTLKYADTPIICISPEEMFELDMRNLQNKLALSRSKNGYFADLLLKYHNVQEMKENQVVSEVEKPNWLKSLFRR